MQEIKSDLKLHLYGVTRREFRYILSQNLLQILSCLVINFG